MSHSHHEASYWTRQHPEPVVLDIGGDDVGALVLYTRPDQHGQEIEVSPTTNTAARTHAAVLERLVNGQSVFAAVYAELPAGEYQVWCDPPRQTTIAAGRVSEVDTR